MEVGSLSFYAMAPFGFPVGSWSRTGGSPLGRQFPRGYALRLYQSNIALLFHHLLGISFVASCGDTASMSYLGTLRTWESGPRVKVVKSQLPCSQSTAAIAWIDLQWHTWDNGLGIPWLHWKACRGYYYDIVARKDTAHLYIHTHARNRNIPPESRVWMATWNKAAGEPHPRQGSPPSLWACPTSCRNREKNKNKIQALPSRTCVFYVRFTPRRYDRGEPAVSYRWTGWVWEITTGWSSRLRENYLSF